MSQCPSPFELYIVFSIIDQSESSEMLTICQIPFVYWTCNLEQSSMTFELPGCQGGFSRLMMKHGGK